MGGGLGGYIWSQRVSFSKTHSEELEYIYDGVCGVVETVCFCDSCKHLYTHMWQQTSQVIMGAVMGYVLVK